jgi:transposase
LDTDPKAVKAMDTFVARCAGLDIGKADLKACVRIPKGQGRRRQEIRTFATTTPALLELRDWLATNEVTVVGMEATGDYWKPVYYLLEDAFDVQLLNARHMRNVPGRKTDVADSAWLAQLIEHGLVRPSFVPPPRIRRLRDLTRYRSTIVQERRIPAYPYDSAASTAACQCPRDLWAPPRSVRGGAALP